MPKKVPIEKVLDDFILSQKKRFSFDSLVSGLNPGEEVLYSEDDILNALENEGLAFSRDFDTFTPRHLFFKKARFMISPTDEEVNDGILIPGHRFMPFLSPRVRPWACTLKTGKGKILEKKVLNRVVRDVQIYYALFGSENLFKILIEDRSENKERLESDAPAETPAAITAFDTADFFKVHHFKFGDGIILTTDDWAKGIYTIEYIAKKNRRSLMKKAKDWTECLETGFRKSFDDLGLDFPLEEQISYAYFYAGKKVMKDPPIHLGGFIESSSLIHFVDYGSEIRLWFDAHLEPTTLRLPDTAEQSPGSSGIENALRDLGIAINEIEVEAYMRDVLFHHHPDPQLVLDRIFLDRDADSLPVDLMTEFRKYFDKLWNRVKKSYNVFSDQKTGQLREQVLKILDRQLRWLRKLDASRIETLIEEEMHLAAQASAFLVDYLRILNMKNPPSDDEIRETLELLPEIDTSLEALRSGVNEHIETSAVRIVEPKLVQPAASKKPSAGRKKAAAGYLYELRISLENIFPAIWRTLRVPASFSLAELHEAIQAAMDWNDYHPHIFTIDGKHYGTPETGELDENSVSLADLKLTEKKKFHYVYDFGDNWVHLVTVERKTPAERSSGTGVSAALCLGGGRASPPEDCGGIPGYAELLTALKTPRKKRSREILDQAGDFDPERFNLAETNLRLGAGSSPGLPPIKK